MLHLFKIKDDNYQLFGVISSLILHLLLFIAAIIVLHFSVANQSSRGGYVEITSGEFETVPVQKAPEAIKEETEEDMTDIKEPAPKDENYKQNETPPAPVEQKKITSTTNAKGYYSFNNENADTNSLNNIYAEPTLNVRIKYPAGWTYIDQNRKKKLDGVTFIASGGIYNPPPYVHLAVEDKNIFMESRYKYKLKTDNYTAYYNDPVELSNQVSQTFYIRTGDDEDYSIKFIMKGQDAFKALQPTFFGMIKSFKFGNSLF